MDTISASRRSDNMRQIKSRDTSPELSIRKLAHRLGYRFRLHRSDLPGRPDLVFPSRRKIIFVHGCFWHQHEGCRHGRPPGSNRDYWLPKLKRNRLRDNNALSALKKSGWKVLVVWECQCKNTAALENRIDRFLA